MNPSPKFIQTKKTKNLRSSVHQIKLDVTLFKNCVSEIAKKFSNYKDNNPVFVFKCLSDFQNKKNKSNYLPQKLHDQVNFEFSTSNTRIKNHKTNIKLKHHDQKALFHIMLHHYPNWKKLGFYIFGKAINTLQKFVKESFCELKSVLFVQDFIGKKFEFLQKGRAQNFWIYSFYSFQKMIH